MKPKSSWTLFAVVAVIVGLILAYQYWYKPGQEEKKKEEAVLFPDLEPDKADRIEIRKGDTVTVLATNGNTAWKVETQGYPADYDAVHRALSMLEGLAANVPASRNPENFDKLGVTPEKAMRVKISRGDSIVAELLVGNQGKSYSSSFVRKPGEDQAYLVYEGLDRVLGKKEWRDRSVFNANPEQVEEVKVTRAAKLAEGDTTESSLPAKKLILRRSGEGEKQKWEIFSGDTTAQVEQGRISGLVKSLCRLKASEFAESVSLQDAGLEKPYAKISLKLDPGDNRTLLIGDKTDSNYFVKRKDSDVIMKVSAYSIDRAFKADEKKETPDPSSMLPPPDLKKKGKRKAVPQMNLPGKTQPGD